MRYVKILLSAMVPLLSACVYQPVVDWGNPEATKSRVNIELDEFKKEVKYRGPDINKSFDTVFIRAWKHIDINQITYQIYARDIYRGDWHFYDSAYDDDGNKLDTTLISRDVVSCGLYGCTYSEDLGINITRGYLSLHTASGIRFKISGTAGEQIFFIPGGYIKGFLAAVPK